MKTVIIIASGPSLTKADVKLCESSGHPLMGINNAYMITDKLKYHYACDTKWWKRHFKKLYPGPIRYSLKANDKDEGVAGVTQMKRGERHGLSHKWPAINHGSNSGYQAINLAYLLGYKQIILLGYDMQETNGVVHWHGLHKEGNNPDEKRFQKWRQFFPALAKELKESGVEVLNATRQTALECFDRIDLEDVAGGLR